MIRHSKEFNLSADEKFAIALADTLKSEGGFVDHHKDPGGATNLGVSLRFLRSAGHELGDIDGDGDIDIDDIKALSRADAAEIYKQHFWDIYRYGELPTSIACRVFDMAVNMGPFQAHLILQRALKACRIGIVVDGKIGLQTRGATSTHVSCYGAAPLMTAIRSEHAAFYTELVEEKPELEVFLKGWLRRACQ